MHTEQRALDMGLPCSFLKPFCVFPWCLLPFLKLTCCKHINYWNQRW
ncbi:hypothetical protein Hanom_Chr11g01003351 [Helianthus anomalus]